MTAAGKSIHKGAVAAGHAETVAAAAAVLETGGNAFDATLAGMLAACVAEPVLASLGGGGFLLADPAGSPGETCIYDFFAQTPRHRRDGDSLSFFPIDADFGTTTQEFHIGLGAAAVPGFVPGFFEVWRRHGSLPLDVIAEPAIGLARDGVRISRYQAYLFGVVGAIYTHDPASLACYGGSAPNGLTVEGDVVRNPDLADVIEAMAREGEDWARIGELAQRMSRVAAENGGHLSPDDFSAYEVHRRTPLVFDFANARVATNPPPSTGGVLIAFAMRLLQATGRDAISAARVMAATNRARGDSGLAALDDRAFKRLLDPDLIASYQEDVADRPQAYRGTTHISVIDMHGNAAAVTLSNGEGCGLVVPGCGFMLNNMLGEEDINPNGFHAWPEDTRMSSMMAPSLIAGPGGARTVLGSGGSNRIRTALMQVMVALAAGVSDLEQVIDAPRFHVEGDTLFIENPADRPFEASAIDALAAEFGSIKVFDERNMFFGGVHAVRDDPASDGIDACGDARRAGTSRIL